MTRPSKTYTHTKHSEIEGYLTGDHECALLFPENKIPSIDEADRDGLYLGDIMPFAVRQSNRAPRDQRQRYRFLITVHAIEEVDDPDE